MFLKNHAKSRVFQKHLQGEAFFELFFFQFEQKFDIFGNFVQSDFFWKIDPPSLFWAKIWAFQKFRLKSSHSQHAIAHPITHTTPLPPCSHSLLNDRKKSTYIIIITNFVIVRMWLVLHVLWLVLHVLYQSLFRSNSLPLPPGYIQDSHSEREARVYLVGRPAGLISDSLDIISSGLWYGWNGTFLENQKLAFWHYRQQKKVHIFEKFI